MTTARPAGGLLLALALLVLCCWSRPVEASEARDLYRLAITRHAVAEFEDAIRLLTRARAMTRDPGLLGKIYLQLGINHAVLGESQKAQASFRLALTHDPALELNPGQIKKSTVALLGQVRRGMSGRLMVTANQAAVVTVDGRRQGSTPHTGRLPVGRHRVEVRRDAQRLVRVVIIRLDRLSRVAARFKVVAARRALPAGKKPRRGRIWTWVAAGAAVTALGVGIGFGLAADSSYDELEALVAGSRRDLEARQKLVDSVESRALTANIIFGVAGAMAVTSVVLLFLEGRSSSSERRGSKRGLQLVPLAGAGPGLLLSTDF